MKEYTKGEVDAVRAYTKNLLKAEISSELRYHNWSVTKLNRNILQDLAKKLKVDTWSRDTALIAIYFLYTGFTKVETKAYKSSLSIAENYMKEHSFDEENTSAVLNCMKIKSEGKDAGTLAERLFSDSVFAYYGQRKLKARIEDSWKERNFMKAEKIDFLTALEKKFLEIQNHKYETYAGEKLYCYKKETNLNALKAYIDGEKNKNALSNNKPAMTMFKTALRNHIDLINIADKKAGIMISINAILMTVMIPILGSYIIDITKFIVPSIILIITSGTAVILATLATRPQASKGDVDEKSKIKGEKSLFYFGNFSKMKKEDYRIAIKNVIVRDNTLENSIISDLYNLGYILGIKYQRLRWCYNVFAVGIALTLITFVLSFWIFPEI